VVVDVPGSLHLETSTPQLLAGSYRKDATTLIFTARPSALNLLCSGRTLLSFVDYGAFMRIHLATAVFLLATAQHDRGNVIDITTIAKSVVLPNTDLASAREPEENHGVFEDIQARFSDQELALAESRFASLMQDLLKRSDAAVLPFLSIKLAAQGITGVTHPSSLAIHMPAMRFARMCKDIEINPALIDSVNALHNNNKAERVVSDAGCEISEECGNACFGMCGKGCSCWSWVCGSCDCYKGCWQHDCCCSCRGTFTACCINVAAVRCNGYNNSCEP